MVIGVPSLGLLLGRDFLGATMSFSRRVIKFDFLNTSCCASSLADGQVWELRSGAKLALMESLSYKDFARVVDYDSWCARRDVCLL